MYPKDGHWTGQWVEKKITGKWARTEYYLVGQQINAHQYHVFIGGNLKLVPSRWGHMAIQHSITEPQKAYRCSQCNKMRPENDYLCYFCRREIDKSTSCR